MVLYQGTFKRFFLFTALSIMTGLSFRSYGSVISKTIFVCYLFPISGTFSDSIFASGSGLSSIFRVPRLAGSDWCPAPQANPILTGECKCQNRSLRPSSRPHVLITLASIFWERKSEIETNPTGQTYTVIQMPDVMKSNIVLPQWLNIKLQNLWMWKTLG